MIGIEPPLGRHWPRGLTVVWAALLCLTFGAPALAGPPADLTPGGVAVVKEALSGDTVLLEDGRTVRLAGIQAPKMGRLRKAPLADEARAALEQLSRGHRVTVLFGAGHVDRHDRVLAQLVRDDGLWLQGEMLERGWARVFSLPDLPSVIAELLAREAPAREAKRGIWGQRAYAVRTPETLGRDYDTFQVVEGRVLSAAVVKGQLYLNFGPDWHTDFTIRAPHRAMRALRALHPDPKVFQGRMIRVRGWVYRHDGPEIDVTVPEMLELLPP